MGAPPASALAAAYLPYAWTQRTGHPAIGPPPYIWTFLSSLGESEILSSLVIGSAFTLEAS